jgi:flagellar biosynthesis anti-sigma factor FlgM
MGDKMMKVEQLNRVNDVERINPIRTPKTGSLPPLNAARTASGSDAVRISERAETVAQLIAKANELPDIRQQRVDSLRALVTNGEFRPSAAEIADSILRDETPFSK